MNERSARPLRSLRWLGLGAVLLLVSGATLAWGPQLPQARALVRVRLEQLLDSLLQGEVQIDHITKLSLSRVEAEGVTVRDPQGRSVLRAKRLVLGLDPLALFTLHLRFTHGLLEDAKVRAIPSGSASISLFDALSPPLDPAQPEREPSSGGLDLSFEHVHLHKAQLYGSVPGLAQLELVGLEARFAIGVRDGALGVEVSQLRGDLTRPYEHAVALEHATFSLHSQPLRLHTRARLTQAHDLVRIALSYRQLDEQQAVMDLLVGADPLSPELLADLHIPAAEVLLSDLRGYARLHGALSDLRLVGSLQTDAGAIALRGRFPTGAPYTLQIASRELELTQLLAYAPPLRMTVALDVSAASDERVQLQLRAPKLELFGIALQDANIVAAYSDDRLTFESAKIRYGAGRFDVSGWIDAEADLALRVRAQVPEVARDPSVRRFGLRGSLRTDVRLSRREGRLAIEGSVGTERPSYGGFEAKELVIEGRASADEALEHAQLDVTGTSWGSAFAGRKIGDVEFRARGTSPRFSADFALIDQRARTASAHVELTRARGGYHLLLSPLEIGVVGREPWRALADLELSRSALRLERVFLGNGPQRLELSGSYVFGAAYQLDATLQSFDLGGLRELSGLDLADLDGTIDGRLSVTGTADEPRIDAQGSVHGGVFLGMSDLTLLVSVAALDRQFDLDAELVLPGGSRMSLFVGGEPGEGGGFREQIAAGSYKFGLDFDQLPFELGRPWLGWLGIEPPGGTISAVVRGEGALSAPALDIETRIDQLALSGYPVLDVELDAEHDGKRTTLHQLRLSDEHGELAHLLGFLEASAEELLDPTALRQSLGTRPLELLLNWKERRLDQLPQPLRVDLALASTGSLRVTQTATGPAIDLRAKLGWSSHAREGAELDACGARRHPEVALTLRAHQQKTHAELKASLDREQLATASLEAETPILDWIAGAAPLALPRTRLTLKAETQAAEEVPGLCSFIAGPLRLEVAARDVFAEPPSLQVLLRSSGLQMVASRTQAQRLGALRGLRTTGRPFALSLQAGIAGPDFTFQSAIDQGRGAQLSVSGSIPRAALLGGELPSARWPHAQIELAARGIELGPLLLALPVGVRVTGKLEGDGRLRYDFARDHVELSGALSLSSGKLALGALGQELSDVRGRLSFADNTARIEQLSARDFDGRLRLDGLLTFDGLRDLRTELTFALADFPIRRESAQVSRLSGELRLRATTTPERTRAELSAGELRVNLPNDLGQGLQSLDEHRDIVVRGRELEPDPVDPHLLELRIVAQDPPFRVLRSDLTAEVAADVTVRQRASSLTLQGSAEIKRGSFELYGKRFELGESRLAFDGSETIDPLVSLDAVHRTGGDEIGVRVEGRVSAPQISFYHSNPAITEPGEIIAQLLGARSADPASAGTDSETNGDATGAAAGVLAGATAGLLTQEVRREFGGALPVLSLESSSQSLRTARIRAGVQLDQLIERRLGPLRRVVRGAYVEGFVAPGASSETVALDSQPQSRGGGLLELRFPRDLVGTIEYRPIQNWRLDLAWEP